MKYLNYAVILIISIVNVACNSDDNTSQSLSQNDIQGEWILTKLNASEPVDLNNDGISSLDLKTETDCFDNMIINFINDSYQFAYPAIDFVGGSNNELNCTDTLNTGTYSLENGILTATTIIDGSSNTKSVPVELTNNQLKFTITSEQVSEYLDLDSTDNENSNLDFLEFVFEK